MGLNWAIPRLEVEALSSAMVVAEVVELERVREPEIAEPEVPPVIESTPVFAKLSVPPKERDPPPERPEPVLMVTEEF